MEDALHKIIILRRCFLMKKTFKKLTALVVVCIFVVSSGSVVTFAEEVQDDTYGGYTSIMPFNNNETGGGWPTPPQPEPPRCGCSSGTPMTCWPGGSFWCSMAGVWLGSPCRC